MSLVLRTVSVTVSPLRGGDTGHGQTHRDRDTLGHGGDTGHAECLQGSFNR